MKQRINKKNKMSSKPVSIKNLDISKIVYTPLTKRKNGGKVMYLTYDGNPLTIQMPTMNIPFGASDYNGNGKFSINLGFDNQNAKHLGALEKLKQLDEKLIKDASKNSKEWFETQRTVEGIRDSFQSQIKYPKDDKYGPTLKVGLQTDLKGAIRCGFTNMTGEKVVVTPENLSEMIPNRSSGISILECVGVWIVQKSVTLTWRVAKLKYERGSSEDFEFNIDSDEEEDNHDNESTVNHANDTESESSVDLDDEEEIKPPVKRGAKAKKISTELEK